MEMKELEGYCASVGSCYRQERGSPISHVCWPLCCIISQAASYPECRTVLFYKANVEDIK